MAFLYFDTEFESNTWIYRGLTEADSNSGLLSIPGLSISGAGVSLQNIVASSPIVDPFSMFYNLDFSPVSGDIIAVPAVWVGSTITVDPNGRFIIDPALPNGAQFPRLSYDVSTGIWYSDVVTVNDGVSSGLLNIPGLSISGAGSISINISGTGTLQIPGLALSGQGFNGAGVYGLGVLNIPGLSILGNGVAGNQIVPVIGGQGAMSIPGLTLLGYGSIDDQEVPSNPFDIPLERSLFVPVEPKAKSIVKFQDPNDIMDYMMDFSEFFDPGELLSAVVTVSNSGISTGITADAISGRVSFFLKNISGEHSVDVTAIGTNGRAKNFGFFVIAQDV